MHASCNKAAPNQIEVIFNYAVEYSDDRLDEDD